ncbi:hypothetical protein PSY31_23945, partial [Shigella flexneri]|nr:hypothetical protein [Shigella flexneri]
VIAVLPRKDVMISTAGSTTFIAHIFLFEAATRNALHQLIVSDVKAFTKNGQSTYMTSNL